MENLDIILEKIELLEKKIDTKSAIKLINRSESLADFSKAFAMFQAEVINPLNSTVNNFFKNKYATLADVLNEVRPVLAKHGLSILQMPSGNDGLVQLTTLIMHTSGEWIETEPMTMRPEKGTPQGIGSCLTYLRRYSLSSILGVASEDDDDGNEASKPDNNKGKSPEPKKSAKKDTVKNELKELIAEIVDKAKILQGDSVAQTDIMEVFKVAGHPNPNTIPNTETAKTILEELNKLG